MGFLNIHSVAKYQTIQGRLFGAIKKFSKNSLIKPKKSKLKTKIAKGGSLVSFRGSGRRFCFGRGSDVPSMFWTCIVQQK